MPGRHSVTRALRSSTTSFAQWRHNLRPSIRRMRRTSTATSTEAHDTENVVAKSPMRVCVDDHILRSSHTASQLNGLDVAASFPNSTLCPITHALMQDPVMIADGYSYERSAILRWLSEHTTSPVTGQVLAHEFVTPSHTLRNTISELVIETTTNARRRRWILPRR